MRLIPVVICALIAFREVRIEFLLLCGSACILAILVYDIYKQKLYKTNDIIKSMLLVLLVMTFSMLYTLSIAHSLIGLAKNITFVIVLFYFYNVKSETKKENISKCFTYLGLVVLMEIAIYFIQNNQIPFVENLRSLNLGWGSYGFISMLYLMIIPLSTYWYISEKKQYILLFIFFGISMGILTMTRGSYIAMIILSIPFSIQVYNDAKNPHLFKQFLMFLIIALLFRLFVSNPMGMTNEWYNRINLISNSKDGKDLVFDLGLRVFKINPLFGTGVHTSPIFLAHTQDLLGGMSTYFQNYIVQTLATLGIVGMFVFINYVNMVFKQTTMNTKYNRYVLYLFLAIMIQGLFDTTIYSGIVMITLSIVFCCLDEKISNI
jgi:hypothetical protein